MKLQHKTLPVAQFKVLDESEGTAEMIVSVFNNVDAAKERILPGFFADSLKARTPKGVWMHDWTMPVAKTLVATELLPGDPLLPRALAKLGGLYVKGQFNLGTQRGRDAFSDLQFGTVDEFSIGYEVTKAQTGKDGTRDLIKGVLYEWSPVLVGCNPDTALLGTKEAPMPKVVRIGVSRPSLKSLYLGDEIEGDMTMSALRTLGQALMYHVFYDCVYGAWDYDDEADDYTLILPTMEEATATLTGALDEYRALVLSTYAALMAGPGADAVGAAKSIKALFDDPSLTHEALPAGAKLGQHSDRALAAVKGLTGRLEGLKALRAKDGRAIGDANRARLKALQGEMTAVLGEVEQLLAPSPDEALSKQIAALRAKALGQQSDLSLLALGG